tara:strand:+ start:101 stop:634 length:534 start_codon:yes stop_codon:yes gene_type:complete
MVTYDSTTGYQEPSRSPLSYAYTSEAEIKRILSSSGFDLRLDDLSNDLDTVTDLINEATDLVNFYCGLHYDESDLEGSTLVRRWTTWIACYLLSQRRGNPAIFADRMGEVLALLEEVARHDRILPRLPTREDLTPAMSNVHIDDKFRTHKIRVHPTISTGGTYGKQDLSPRFPFEWL